MMKNDLDDKDFSTNCMMFVCLYLIDIHNFIK